ncbi:response regulator [Phenylobacterium sp. LjRoot225]|uniref:PP2C family protein-serine/threonine phosphatase n=1 Tax=Phenylobacterium sp. LjRoot225 TaxID=3342285 RepID=UPI003ED062C7
MNTDWLRPSPSSRPSPSPVSVLVADDDPIVRELIAAQIEALGYEVRTAEDGRAAAAAAELNWPDVLVTDWSMPGMDGIELIRHLRARSAPGRYLHVILMTTSSAAEAIGAGLEAGADDYVPKPLDMMRLRLGLASAGRLVHLQRQLQRKNQRLGRAHSRLRDAFRMTRRDLQAAAASQRRLLPNPRHEGPIRFDWLFLPSNVIGGDLFDVAPRPGGGAFAFHIDVAGHGVPAALRSTFLHDRLLRGAGSGDLRSTAKEISDALLEDAADDSYCTAALALFDPEGALALLLAGHPAPRLLRRNGGITALEEGGFPLGLIDAPVPEPMTLAFESGDRLFLYSDGLVDCGSEPLGEEGLDALIEETAGLELSVVISRFQSAMVERKGAAFSDDVSLLVIENSR